MARPTISLQAAVGPGSAPTNVFIIGQSLLGGSDVLAGAIALAEHSWVEIGDWCDRISIRRGRERLLEQYRAGTVHAGLDNTDGRFDPAWTEGPYSSGATDLTDENGNVLTDENGFPLWAGDGVRSSNLRSNNAIRVQLTYLGVVYDRVFGYVDDWAPVFEYPEGGRSSVSATDAFKVFSAIELPAEASQGSGELTGARLDRILDAVDWSSVWRDLDDGVATHDATTLEGNVAAQLRLVADSERGDFFVAGDGTPTHRGRHYRLTSVRSRQVQWVIGDGDGELNPSAFKPANEEVLVRNDVRVSRVGGATVVRQTADAAVYPHKRRTYARSDLTLADDAQVVDYADWVLRLFGEQAPRVDWVEFEPDGADDSQLWEFIVQARWGDRVTVNVRHPHDGRLWSGVYFVEGFDEDIPVIQDGQWRTRFYLADASQFPTSAFIIGSSLLGGVDVLI